MKITTILFFSVLCFMGVSAQTTHTTASQEGDNNFTGTNTHTGSETFSAITATGNVSVGGTLGAGQINKRFFVDGTKYPITQAGIQQAFTDACVGQGGFINGFANTEVFLPTNVSIAVSNTTGQQFLVTCPLHIHGPGQGLWFNIANTVPNTVPLFRLQPAGANQGFWEIDSFRVISGGNFGGDAFFLDSTNGTVVHLDIHNVDVSGLDPAAWFINMNATTGNQFFAGRIWDNSAFAGINMNSTSTNDSWLIEHNAFGSTAGSNNPCINATTQSGAAHITAFNNNGGCTGGFFISHGTTQCKILYNQIEQTLASTETNSSVIDLIGDTYSINQCEIRGNNINAHTFATNNIRVGVASNTIIDGNVISVKPTTGVGIVITASSSGTSVSNTNTFPGVGGGAVAMTNGTSSNPFSVSLPTATNTLPASVLNDSAGGVELLTNSGFAWAVGNGAGTLFSPAGASIGLGGATSGTALVKSAAIGGGVHTFPINGGGINETPATDSHDNQSATIGPVTLLTGTANTGGFYFLSAMVICTTSDASGATVTPSATYTVGGSTQTVTGAALNLNSSTNNQVRFTIPISADASTNITFTATVTGSPSTAKYSSRAALIRQ